MIRSKILTAAALIVVSLALGLLTAFALQAKEIGVAEFTDKTRVQGVILQGKYLVVHDEEKMSAGQACVYIYSYNDGEDFDKVAADRSKLVASFHCVPVQRDPAREVVLTFGASKDPSVFELKEIQLPGSTHGHRVP